MNTLTRFKTMEKQEIITKISKYGIPTPAINVKINGVEFEANEPTVRNLLIGMFKGEFNDFYIKDDFGNWIEVSDDGRIGDEDYSIEGLQLCARLIGQLWQLRYNN